MTSVAGGEEALQAVAHEQPDLILMDVMMPGLNGFGSPPSARCRPPPVSFQSCS